MAEFCSECNNVFDMPDHYLPLIALRLKDGFTYSFICEGCNVRGIAKDEKGNLYLLKENDKTIVEEPTTLLKLVF